MGCAAGRFRRIRAETETRICGSGLHLD